ncbi:MAG TPA: hypothetical protein PK156_45020, partial [Polyangium sp.]|nr:hypothetical protein [Polyangium sp.]
ATSCPDVVNLMFPIATANKGVELTTAQIRVIQGSALYRGVYEPGGAPDPASKAVAPEHSYKSESSFSAVEGSDKLMPADPTPLEQLIGAVWCAHGHTDYEALVARHAGASTTGLRTLALDETRPDFMRARALGMYVRFAVGAERDRALDLAEDFAIQAQNSTSLRVAALTMLDRFDADRARSMARALSVATVATNPVLMQRAQRILMK